MEPARGLFTHTFWFADVTFAAGMWMALNSEKTRGKFKDLSMFINKNFILSKKTVPQHFEKSLDLVTPTLAYKAIQIVLYFCFTWNLLNMLINPKQRNPIFNVTYFFYPLLTVRVSAYDILLDDDKSCWAPDVKRRHVLFPLNLENSKVFAEKLNKPAVESQIKSLERLVRKYSFDAVLGIFCVFFAASLPRVIFFLAAPFFLPATRSFLLTIDHTLDMASLRLTGNRFEHLFGDYWDIVKKDDKHEFFGRQYQYFLFSSRPLEKLCYTMFFKKARATGCNVAEAKAIYYLGRGSVVVLLIFLCNLIDVRTQGASVILTLMTYYLIHALAAYFLHSSSTNFELDLLRILSMIVEMEVSGYFFYKPLLEALETAKT